MTEAFVIFPVHLFENIAMLKNKICYLVEEIKYFNRNHKMSPGMKLKFNIMKPIYHRATMKEYYNYLKSKNINIKYLEADTNWIKYIKNKKIDKILCYDPVDRDVKKKIKNYKNYEIFDSPGFLTSYEELSNYDGPLLQTSFYIWQRKRLNILIDKNNKPIKGKWTFDSENRKSPYKGIEEDLPDYYIYNNDYIKEARSYIKKKFLDKHLYDNENNEFIFPISFSDSKKQFKTFLKKSLNNFGDYQDAFLADEDSSPLLFHSGISVMMNIGLLTPKYIIDETLKYHKNNKKIKYNNIEGFIRQIIGWREFCRYIYEFKSKLYLNKNHFNNKKRLNDKWYTGELDIEPVDTCIKKAFRYGYLHHIERLMVMANFMTISEIHPKEMFKWFSEFSLDSYDWVMEYNIYAMGSYSDGGTFTTKPYISTSNYVLKMSDHTKEKNDENNKSVSWNDKWDKLFWNFMYDNRVKIKKIPRLSMLLKFAKDKK